MGEAPQGPISWGSKASLSTLDMCTCAQIGLARCAPSVEVSCGKEPSQYWHAFPHGADGARSRCCSESAGELGGLCLPWVWFGYEKHPAGRWQPEHVGRPLCQLNSLAACRTQVKASPLDRQGRGTCSWVVSGGSCPRAACCWGRGSWSPLWMLHQSPRGGSLPWLKLQPLASVCPVWGQLDGSSHDKWMWMWMCFQTIAQPLASLPMLVLARQEGWCTQSVYTHTGITWPLTVPVKVSACI